MWSLQKKRPTIIYGFGLKMQTVEQQRHILKMLEKSLARELDMEKKLSESRNIEEELKKKLCFAEHELSQMEEEAEGVLGRLFEAEIAAEVTYGNFKGNNAAPPNS
ncbi:hypothetical protein IFM89_003362 [Coptis chinensis]|uniref:Uncharacterized protein n=1 Tax=Coptis chinensis TaxID=261450 RepID=A0A835MBJ8_9MAGN|nr:hypothetical protein IFM89_003362 [Coptis chinensis]